MHNTSVIHPLGDDVLWCLKHPAYLIQVLGGITPVLLGMTVDPLVQAYFIIGIITISHYSRSLKVAYFKSLSDTFQSAISQAKKVSISQFKLTTSKTLAFGHPLTPPSPFLCWVMMMIPIHDD